jgi:hypothetical protein
MLRAARDAEVKAASEPKYVATRDAAKADLAELEKRIGRVSVTLEHAPDGAAVTVNGEAVAESQLGSPVPLVPGHVKVVAHAPGRDDMIKELNVAPGETKSVTLAFKSASKPEAVAEPEPVTPPPTDTPAPSSSSPMRPIGIALVALGAVGMGVFAGTGLAASSDYRTLQNECKGHCTDPKYDSVIKQGRTLETVSNVGLVVGLASLAGGGALILFGGPKSKPASSASVSFAPGGGTIQYRGTF